MKTAFWIGCVCMVVGLYGYVVMYLFPPYPQILQIISPVAIIAGLALFLAEKVS